MDCSNIDSANCCQPSVGGEQAGQFQTVNMEKIMRQVLYSAIVVVLVAGVAAAQDFPRVEILGGYSLLKLGGDVDDVINDFESGAPAEMDISDSKLFKRGFNASIAFNANEYFGIEAGFLYNRGDLVEASGTVEGDSIDAKLKAWHFAFMAGPRFTYRKNEKVTPYAHALFGVDHFNLEPTLNVNGEDNSSEVSEFSGSDNGFGMAVGGGIIVHLRKRLINQFISNRT